MDKKKKILTGAGVVILAGVLGAGIYFSRMDAGEKNQQLAYVSGISAMNGQGAVQRLAGVVEPQKTWEIQKSAEREVKDILVEAGDEVDVGTALFNYDTETLEAELEQAQLDLERTDNSMVNLREQIAQLESEKKDAPEDEQLSYTTQIQSAQMDLKKAEYERKSKEVSIAQTQDKIANSTFVSDMKGVVKSINEKNEMDPYSGNTQAFMTILATGEFRVKGKVNEQNMWTVQEGARAIIRSRVDETVTWSGTFSSINTDEAINNNNNSMFYGGASDSGETVSSSYAFYVNLDSSENLLLGQHVYIEADTGAEKKEGIWLDEGYIVNTDTEPFVWAENKDGKLEKKEVVLGEYDEDTFQYEIQKGLKTSDYIAFPQEFLKEGMKTTHDEASMFNESEVENGQEMEIQPEGEGV